VDGRKDLGIVVEDLTDRTESGTITSVTGYESTFARMEPLGSGGFALYFMRYTGKEWVGAFDALTVDESVKTLQDDEWFMP
jgi:hypothetical protein